ncbi:MAG: hypothetical protein JWN48_3354 [Myxococcaceae bacterium]|nr:hypothetical protein [Myxococcaceae bacterium]
MARAVVHSRRALAAQTLLLLHVAVLAAGCSVAVPLGDECPRDRECVLTRPGGEVAIPVPGLVPLPVEPRGGLDAGLDGMVSTLMPADASDAETQAPFEPLELYNLSFERHGGVGGDVVLSNTVSFLVPVPPVDTIFAELPNWFACIPLSVSSLTWQQHTDAGFSPSAFGDYLSFVINGTTVRQALGSPMTVGHSYSLEALVLWHYDGAPAPHLEVRGSTSTCGAGYILGRSAVVPDANNWARTCVTFRADKPYSYLLLAPAVDTGKAPASARFYLDELRQVASCPGVP